MKNNSNPGLMPSFFFASIALLQGLSSLLSALDYKGLENNFIADNWEFPLIIFMIFTFVIGWGIESFGEHMIMRGRRGVPGILFLMVILLYCAASLGSLLLDGFVEHALRACGCMLAAGCFYKLSTIHPEVLDKFKMRE